LEGENDGNLKDLLQPKKRIIYILFKETKQASKHPFDAFLENMLVEESFINKLFKEIVEE
jgi:hypothetical protein